MRRLEQQASGHSQERRAAVEQGGRATREVSRVDLQSFGADYPAEELFILTVCCKVVAPPRDESLGLSAAGASYAVD